MLGRNPHGLILPENCCFILLSTCSNSPDKANTVLTGRGRNGTFLHTQIRMIYNHHADRLSKSAGTAELLSEADVSLRGVVEREW